MLIMIRRISIQTIAPCEIRSSCTNDQHIIWTAKIQAKTIILGPFRRSGNKLDMEKITVSCTYITMTTPVLLGPLCPSRGKASRETHDHARSLPLVPVREIPKTRLSEVGYRDYHLLGHLCLS
ncbi:hypothetical protein SERLA73DRAFT_181191 [Serpula lacrymans var. lacrymans S7.3]|uniref:Uncharacterized protein n=1 Tax=Serpula lacrymans var. lacrymans (strain S7.3) TaxID=936435 RepID=F8PXM2_SERL3|nr:hypothetical protein SERLA73DRAFT_181191 [Serpula lacrymans var. lacrymans S7.3]